MFTNKITSNHIFGVLLSFLLFALPAVMSFPSGRSITTYTYHIIGSVLCLATYKAVQNPKYRVWMQAVLYLLVLISAISAIQGIYQYIFLGINRPQGPFTNTNILAMNIEIMIPVVLAILLSKQNSYIKAVLSVTLLLLAGGLLVSLSRGAWLAVIIVVPALLIIEKNYKILLSVCGTAIAVLCFRYNDVLMRIQSIFDLQMSSNAERLNAFYSSLAMIQAYPFGVGFKNFKQAYPQFMLPEAKELVSHAHNQVLVYATEAGILAAIAFIVFFFLSGIYVYNYYPQINNEYHRLLTLGISGGVMTILLHGLVDKTLQQSSTLLIVMYMIGLALGIVRSYTVKNKTSVQGKM